MSEELDRLITNSFSMFDDSHRPQQQQQAEEADAPLTLDEDQRKYFNEMAKEGYRLYTSFPTLRRLSVCSAYVTRKRQIYENSKELRSQRKYKQAQQHSNRKTKPKINHKTNTKGHKLSRTRGHCSSVKPLAAPTNSTEDQRTRKILIPFVPDLNDLPVAYLSENQINSNQAGDKKIDVYIPSGELKVIIRGTKITKIDDESILKGLVFVEDKIILFDNEEFRNVSLVKKRGNEPIRKLTVVGQRVKNQLPPIPPPPTQVIVAEKEAPSRQLATVKEKTVSLMKRLSLESSSKLFFLLCIGYLILGG